MYREPSEFSPDTFLMEHSASFPSPFFIPVIVLYQSGPQPLEVNPNSFLMGHLREFAQAVMPLC